VTTPAGRRPGRKTYTRLATGRRVPLEYELVSTDLHYNHPMRSELSAARDTSAHLGLPHARPGRAAADG